MPENEPTDDDPTREPAGPAELTRQLRLGDLIVDTQARTVRREGEAIDLPHLSWLLLIALARRWPAVASQEELMADVWPGVFVGEEVLTQRIKLLRQSLGDDSRRPRYVQTVRGAGYGLAVAVEGVEEPPEAPGAGRGPVRRWLLSAVAAIALALIAVTFLRPPVEETDVSSTGRLQGTAIAILPFDDLSPAGGPEHFAAALHDEILGRLSRVAALRVTPRTSVLGIRDEASGIREIAQRLDVDAVAEGSVRQVSNQISVSIRLLDAKDETHLWSNNYVRELSVANLAAIQGDVAERIAEALRVELSAAERQSIARLPTASLDAYNAYLLGRYHAFQHTPEGLDEAISFFSQAVEIDPEFAQAWAALASAHSFVGTSYGQVPPKEAYGRAKAAVLRALALDGGLVDAHAVYADILAWYDWDWRAAEREYLKTKRLNPDYVLGYAILLSVQQRHEEAGELLRPLVERHPEDPWVRINAAWRYLAARRYRRAIEEARLADDHRDVNRVLGWAHLGLGEPETALAFFQRAVERNGRHPVALSNLAAAYAAAGRESEARALLAELLALYEKRYLSPALIAQVYLHFGEHAEAFSWLERALEMRTRDLIFLPVDPAYDDVRDDSRYLKLVEAIGLRNPDERAAASGR